MKNRCLNTVKNTFTVTRIAKLKIIYERQRGYLSIIIFINTMYLVGFKWWMLSFVPLLIVWTWYDWKYIWPEERKIRLKDAIK